MAGHILVRASTAPQVDVEDHHKDLVMVEMEALAAVAPNDSTLRGVVVMMMDEDRSRTMEGDKMVMGQVMTITGMAMTIMTRVIDWVPIWDFMFFETVFLNIEL